MKGIIHPELEGHIKEIIDPIDSELVSVIEQSFVDTIKGLILNHIEKPDPKTKTFDIGFGIVTIDTKDSKAAANVTIDVKDDFKTVVEDGTKGEFLVSEVFSEEFNTKMAEGGMKMSLAVTDGIASVVNEALAIIGRNHITENSKYMITLKGLGDLIFDYKDDTLKIVFDVHELSKYIVKNFNKAA